MLLHPAGEFTTAVSTLQTSQQMSTQRNLAQRHTTETVLNLQQQLPGNQLNGKPPPSLIRILVGLQRRSY